jgi:hypothetical protein
MHSEGKVWSITIMAGSTNALQRRPYVDAVLARDDPKPFLLQLARPVVRTVRRLQGATNGDGGRIGWPRAGRGSSSASSRSSR